MRRFGPLVAVLAVFLAGAWPQARAADGFESPSLRASELLPPELIRGPHHQVAEEVGSDGFQPVFQVSSEFGSFEARGIDALQERVREIDALAALRQGPAAPTPQAQPSAGAAPAAGSVPSGGSLRPGLPVGAWGAAPKAGNLTLGGPKGGEGFVDLDAMKRTVAHRLGIDPHTQNAELQQELQQHVWAAWAGKSQSSLTQADAPEHSDSFQDPARSEELLRDYSAEDLRRLHNIELAVMGVDEMLREEFLANPHYTSSHGVRLLDSLSALEDTSDRQAFIAAASAASSPEEARDFGRLAELLRQYGENTGSLERLVTVGGRVAATTGDGTLLVPVLGEHSAWTQSVASFAESLALAAGEDPEVTRTRLLFSGSLSERARQEMESLGLSVAEEGLSGESDSAD